MKNTSHNGYYQKTGNVDKGVEREHCEIFIGVQIVVAIIEKSLRFLKKIKMVLPYYAIILVLGIYQKKVKTQLQRGIHCPIFIRTLFT